MNLYWFFNVLPVLVLGKCDFVQRCSHSQITVSGRFRFFQKFEL